MMPLQKEVPRSDRSQPQDPNTRVTRVGGEKFYDVEKLVCLHAGEDFNGTNSIVGKALHADEPPHLLREDRVVFGLPLVESDVLQENNAFRLRSLSKVKSTSARAQSGYRQKLLCHPLRTSQSRVSCNKHEDVIHVLHRMRPYKVSSKSNVDCFTCTTTQYLGKRSPSPGLLFAHARRGFHAFRGQAIVMINGPWGTFQATSACRVKPELCRRWRN